MQTITSSIEKVLLGDFTKQFAAAFPNVDPARLQEIIKDHLAVGKKDNGKTSKTPKPGVKTETAVVKAPLVIIDRDPIAGVWIIKGTQFVIKSASDTTVIGKVRMNKTVPLSTVEKAECKKKGWVVADD